MHFFYLRKYYYKIINKSLIAIITKRSVADKAKKIRRVSKLLS